MATFTNQATLSYNGVVTNSNITVGELVEVLSVTKTAVNATYTADSNVAYVISILNSGTAAFNGLTVTDNLGAYEVGTQTVYPLTANPDSVRYFVNGVLQPTPTVTAGPPFTVSGINVPAGGNAIILYEAATNGFSPLADNGSITNEATVTGNGPATLLTATETVRAAAIPLLAVNKTLSPLTVTENGTVTYTFTIINTGNTAAEATDAAVLSDTFDPALSNITVTFNGTQWTQGVNYTYNEATGQFDTVSGQVTVPAATYTQDPVTGVFTTTPGISTLVVTGTV